MNYNCAVIITVYIYYKKLNLKYFEKWRNFLKGTYHVHPES